jgi:hypothetical protein
MPASLAPRAREKVAIIYTKGCRIAALSTFRDLAMKPVTYDDIANLLIWFGIAGVIAGLALACVLRRR